MLQEIMPLFYFFQLLSNWPRALLYLRDSTFDPTMTNIDITVTRDFRDSLPMINTVENLELLYSSTKLSVCNQNSHVNFTNYHFHWEILQADELIRSVVSNSCEIFTSLKDTLPYTVYVTITPLTESSNSRKFVGKSEIRWKSKWVAILGDSFASGEGNPDIPYSLGMKSRRGDSAIPAKWLNETCRRSAHSFAVGVFRAFHRRYPESFLSFLACTGASVEKGILNGDNSQIEAIQQISKERGAPPELIVMTLGGNDIGLSDILQNPNFIDKNRGNIDMRFFYASHQLDKIAMKFKEIGIRNVLVPLYYDISRNENGDIDADCGKLPTITTNSLTLAVKFIYERLNNLLLSKGRKNGWTVIETVPELFRRHGICSNDSYIRTIEESMKIQGNSLGALHPNQLAHQKIAEMIRQRLRL